jgi:hypothetical protein
VYRRFVWKRFVEETFRMCAVKKDGKIFANFCIAKFRILFNCISAIRGNFSCSTRLK